MNGRILIVDDEQIIRGMLEAELSEKYDVHTATNAMQALKLCEESVYDLVISDINMPGMKGYDLLAKIKKIYPKTKVALITAYNIDDYIRLAKQHGISNIIPKTTPFNFDELNTMVYGLISENIFGIARYMQDGYKTIAKYILKSSKEIPGIENDIIEKVKGFLREENFLRVQLEEVISNAVYHAPMDDFGKEKYVKHSDVVLAPEEYVDIVLAKDNEKYGVSVTDKSGRLTKETALFKIDRNIHAEGLLDENGRGIHMTRLYSDRLIINIDPMEKTEVIMINYFAEKYRGHKPLYINEL